MVLREVKLVLGIPRVRSINKNSIDDIYCMTDPLDGIEDPMQGSLIVTVIQKIGEPLRIESNAVTENDLIATLAKAVVTASLDSLIPDDGDFDVEEEECDEEE